MTYFRFLYNFCYKPFLLNEFPAKGICWDPPPAYTTKLRRNNPRYYMNSGAKLYHNRLAKLLEIMNVQSLLNQRLEKYFENIFIDEVQDFAGHDFNLLMNICKININIILVGDFFQHTFDTSRDGVVNRNLHKDLSVYQSRFTKVKIKIDSQTLSHSYRCSPTLCDFVTEKVGIPISSHREDETKICLIEDMSIMEEKFHCNNTVKLFYQSHNKYSCYSQNWGASKGEDHYHDVCIVLNKNSYDLFKLGELHKLNPQTRNKLYVACTRARGDLYLASDQLLKSYR